MFRRFAFALLSIATISFWIPAACAQSALLDLPRDSQHSRVEQTIGITEVTINYHRPLVKGRTIWGKVVPYGEVWRAGANENTTITFTDPVSVEGKQLAAGTYGLFMIPNQDEWTVIFSNIHTAWGAFTYKQADDALRVSVKPQASDMHEALSYDFDGVEPDSAVATLRWEKIAVPVKISVNVHDLVQASLHNQLQGLGQYTWEAWDDAANYLLAQKYDLDEALKYENNSVQTEKRYDNLMTKSKILDALGRKDDATVAQTQALEVASPIQLYGYGRQLQRDGKQDQAFDLYRKALKKDPNDWVALVGSARIHSAQGDFDTALKEVQLSQAGAPDNQKVFLDPLIKKLQARQDINKAN